VAVAVIVIFAVIGIVMLRILRRKPGGHSPMFAVGASGKAKKPLLFNVTVMTLWT
jgi:hypothetical protein